ncbi:unnamed protein product [Brassica rapa]|uniref:Uncharacterized protein n=2 Tax=Brassica TaxID=3705 RepID=A0A8D9GRS7_BRACM|nr:unnamed protein product [Brassica napus]CAG7885795.1 unnamed protein product [Brassica rapa]
MPSELLKACYGEGNPSTLYIKAIFEGEGKVEENIKKLMATEFDHAHNNGLDLHWSG